MKPLVLLLLLAACDRAEVEPEAARGVAIDCATGGATALAPDCVVQKTERGGRTLLTLIAPDGGFRRLEARADGAGIDTADGAAHASTTAEASGTVMVTVDGDRYRLPANR